MVGTETCTTSKPRRRPVLRTRTVTLTSSPGVRRRRTVESLIAPRVYPRPWPNGRHVLPADPSADECRALVNPHAAGALWRQFEGLKSGRRRVVGIGSLRPDQMAAGL